MMEAAEDLRIGTEAEVREVEEGQCVVVAQIEEQVRRTLIVAVLEQLDQWESEQLLVEADRPLHVGTQEREMMHAASLGGRPGRRLLEVRRAQPLALGCGGFEVDGHRPRSHAALAPNMFARAGSASPATARSAAAIGSATPSACGQSLPIMNVSSPTLGTRRLGIS